MILAMSCVVLQIGQCGNQVGQSFWNQVDNLSGPDVHLFRHPITGHYRSVSVDTEPKVLRRLCRASTFRKENIIMDRTGRGGNWAFGYNGRKIADGADIFEKLMASMRKEIERCDNFCGTVLVHSLGGGTGSGVGSRAVELLRDEYPMNYLISCAVTPFVTGESPLQNYNALLSLSALSSLADGIVMFSNDDLMSRLLRRCTQPPHEAISLNDINRHIGMCMAGAMMPTDSLTAKTGLSIGLEPWEMLRSLCPMPTHKFLHINSVLRKKSSWEEMTSSLIHSLTRRNSEGAVFSSLANVVVARGDENQKFNSFMPRIETQIKSAYCTIKWNPFPVDFWISAKNSIVSTAAKSLTVGSNYSNIIPQLEGILQSSQTKLSARAYLHWYEKYGCTNEDFVVAFDKLQTVIDAYKEAIK